MMNDYRFTPTADSITQLGDHVRLLSMIFRQTGKFTIDFLSWQYLENPDGPVVGFDAWHGDVLAAHYVTIPLKARVNGATVNGLLSLNTATHPSHQGKKLFTRLAARCYEHAAQMGYNFVIGVANANSTHGFVNKLGFSLVSPLDVRLGLSPFGALQPPDPYPFGLEWRDEKLAWRLKQPGARYASRLYKGRHYLFAPTGIAGIQAQLASFAQLPEQARPPHRRSQPLNLWIGLDRRNTGHQFYLNVPDRFKPSPLNLIFLPLAPGDAPKADSIQFSLIDFDAY